jgi:Uma2 family endonuclease
VEVNVAEAALAVSNRYFTYADYKEWELAEGERFELINGIAYEMAAPGDYHQAISGELFRQIANYLRGKPCRVRAAPYDVRLFYEEDETDGTVVQPDVSVICDERKRGSEGCRGAPDLVVEIVSPGNTVSEMLRKFDLYFRAGVREYWVVYPEERTVHVHRFDGPQIITRVYREQDTVPVGVLEGLSIELEPVFAP